MMGCTLAVSLDCFMHVGKICAILPTCVKESSVGIEAIPLADFLADLPA